MPTFFTESTAAEEPKTYELKPFPTTDGGYASDHACLIPHEMPIVGRTNRSSMTIGGLSVPANVYHYINPDYHKPYARWMPPFSLIKHVLTGAYTEEDSALPGNSNGFISYVTKKGINRDGISDFGIRSGCNVSVQDKALHGRLVATGGSDSNVADYELAYVQTEAFEPLCREVAQRLFALILVSYEQDDDTETFFKKCFPGVDIQNMIASYEDAQTEEATITFKEPDQSILDLMEAYKTVLQTGQYQSPEFTRVRGTGELVQARTEDEAAEEAGTPDPTYCSSDDEIAQTEARHGRQCNIM
jgi:hypothetical protein